MWFNVSIRKIQQVFQRHYNVAEKTIVAPQGTINVLFHSYTVDKWTLPHSIIMYDIYIVSTQKCTKLKTIKRVINSLWWSFL